MKYLLAFMLFLCCSFELSAIYSVHQQGDSTSNSVVVVRNPTGFKPKKLSYKERVALNYVRLKTKLKAKLSDEALTFVITGAILLLLGVAILVGGNKKRNNSTQQGGVGNESVALGAVLGIVAVAAGILCFLIALIDSI